MNSKIVRTAATQAWTTPGPQGPHAPSDLGKGGINNNNEYDVSYEVAFAESGVSQVR